MTPERARELLPIIQAYADGKTIQFLDPDEHIWKDCHARTNFLFWAEYNYRVKPERRKVWVHFNNDGVPFVCRDDNEHFRCTAGCKVVCVEEPEA